MSSDVTIYIPTFGEFYLFNISVPSYSPDITAPFRTWISFYGQWRLRDNEHGCRGSNWFIAPQFSRASMLRPAGMSTHPDPHDDVIKWKHFPRYWPFVRGIHRSPVNFPYKGQWRGALMFSLICIRLNGWVNNGEAGDLRRLCVHYDVTVMPFPVYVIAFDELYLISGETYCHQITRTPEGIEL